jgi:hypothetical protein
LIYAFDFKLYVPYRIIKIIPTIFKEFPEIINIFDINILKMIAKLVSTFVLVSFTLIFLNLFSFSILEAYSVNEVSQKYNNTINFDNLLAEYINWWVNVPSEEDPQELANPCVIHNTDSVIFLHDPFEMGNIKNTCTISQKSLFFPFYNGWCTTGHKDLYGTTSYEKVLKCTLDSNRGIVTMTAHLDDQKIVDVLIDNTDVNNLKVRYNNSLDSYYKEIGPTNFFDLTVTNKTQFTSYEKPEDFAASPAKYKAVAYCFCGFIDKDKITPGNHLLTYYTKIEGSGGLDKEKGWDHQSKITYILTVK